LQVYFRYTLNFAFQDRDIDCTILTNSHIKHILDLILGHVYCAEKKYSK